MRRLAIPILLGTLLGWSAAGAPTHQKDRPHDWRQFRGGPGHTGVSADHAVKPPPKLVWSYRCAGDTSGDAGAGVIVANGKVFTNIAMARSVVALDAHTGRFLREYDHRDMHYKQMSSCDDGRLCVSLRAEKQG